MSYNSKFGKRYSQAEKQEILKQVEKIGVRQAAKENNVSAATVYSWRKQYQKHGLAGLDDGRQNNSGANPVPDWKRKKVLAVKETDPGFGPSQIRNQLRRAGVTISIESVRNILNEAGYELERRHAPKQKVYLVLLLDDYSRFLLNFTLLEQCNMELIEQMVQQAIQRYGKMERIVSDRGFVFHGWRGINGFEKFLEDMDIYHIHTSPYHPETIGKIEAVNKNIQKELINQIEFESIACAREKVADWIWRYNYHRVHQGLDGLCVAADRFHGWLPLIEKELSKLVENGIDISSRHINLFNISLNHGKIMLTILGKKAYLLQEHNNA
jgi:putative transposase